MGHGVEDLAQEEAATGGDLDGGLVEVGGAAAGQRPEVAALEIDLRPAAGVATADQLGDEATIGVEVLEVAAGAQEQRLLDRRFEMTMPALDGPVLVGLAAVVTGRRHVVVAAQGIVASGDVLDLLACEVAVGCREAVGAVSCRRAAERPERVLHAFGQGGEALAPRAVLGTARLAGHWGRPRRARSPNRPARSGRGACAGLLAGIASRRGSSVFLTDDGRGAHRRS